jgi:hypothetical protein
VDTGKAAEEGVLSQACLEQANWKCHCCTLVLAVGMQSSCCHSCCCAVARGHELGAVLRRRKGTGLCDLITGWVRWLGKRPFSAQHQQLLLLLFLFRSGRARIAVKCAVSGEHVDEKKACAFDTMWQGLLLAAAPQHSLTEGSLYSARNSAVISTIIVVMHVDQCAGLCSSWLHRVLGSVLHSRRSVLPGSTFSNRTW